MTTTQFNKINVYVVDINECKVDNGGCDHVCQDFDGGHWCKCDAGFKLMKDGKSCEGERIDNC